MNKKIIVIGFLGMFLLTNIASIGVIAEKQQIQIQNIKKPSEEVADLLFSIIGKQPNIDPELKNLVKNLQ